MIEVVVLFFIVIVIVLCFLSIMYKCTDGSMDTNDFSVDTCFKLGDPKKDDDKSSTNKDDSVTESPLLSGGGLVGSLFGSSLSEDEEDIDYSSYVDYYTISKDGVKVNEYGDLDEDGNPDFVDSIEVDANGPGECAKICYDNTEDIGGYECNAFKMNSNDRKCKLYWSQTSSGETEVENVFRLKTPRSPYTHTNQVLSEVEQSGSNVIMYRDPHYTNPGLLYNSNVYFRYGMEEGNYDLYDRGPIGSPGTWEETTSPPNSFYIPSGYCVKVFSESQGGGEETEYNISVDDVSDKTIKSFMIGRDSDSGTCEYSENNVTYRPRYHEQYDDWFYKKWPINIWKEYHGGTNLTVEQENTLKVESPVQHESAIQ